MGCKAAKGNRHGGQGRVRAGGTVRFTDVVPVNYITFIIELILNDIFIWFYSCIRFIKVDIFT